MKTYGLILADNGSNWFFQGTADSRWSYTDVDDLKQIPASAFQAVDESCLMVDPDSGQALQPGTQAYAAGCPGELEFTSDASTTVQAGSSFDDTVTTASTPTPAISESGALPPGVTFTDNGDGTATLAGEVPSGTSGLYPLTITASNGDEPDAVQDFTLGVATTPTITTVSPPKGPSDGGSSITVTGTGFVGVTSVSVGGQTSGNDAVTSPTSITATVPAGSVGPADVTVATVAGSVTAPGAFTYVLGGCDPPQITSPAAATVVAGSETDLTATTCSSKTPTIRGSGLPPGLTLVNNGDGTALITGLPHAKDAGSYTSLITAAVPGQPKASQQIVITVDNTPAFEPTAKKTVPPGTPFSFTLTTLHGFPTPALTTTSNLPAGVTLTDNENGTATLSGTPGSSAGGVYDIALQAANGVGTTPRQTIVLTCDQTPEITSADSTTVTAGTPMTPFPVTSTGFPAARLKATGLPPGLHLTGQAGGTAAITGTPRASASFANDTVTITATSKAGVANQAFALQVSPG